MVIVCFLFWANDGFKYVVPLSAHCSRTKKIIKSESTCRIIVLDDWTQLDTESVVYFGLRSERVTAISIYIGFRWNPHRSMQRSPNFVNLINGDRFFIRWFARFGQIIIIICDKFPLRFSCCVRFLDADTNRNEIRKPNRRQWCRVPREHTRNWISNTHVIQKLFKLSVCGWRSW